MTIPDAVRMEVEAALARSRPAGRLVRTSPVGGGCISPAARVETGGGERYFLKWAGEGSGPPDFFTSQAEALRALAGAGAVPVPCVEAVAERWLLLEWLEPGAANERTWPALGEQLAQLHRDRARAFGWDADNYIGSLPQSNGAHESWPAYWAERRVGPQWERARRAGYFEAADDSAFQAMASAFPDLLAAGDADGPSLVHGDLWGGNIHVMADGRAALIDPAPYRGHREVDVAMAELFGGFDPVFFRVYREAWPLHPGYDEERRDLYQLYYLLVHVNLFGQGYVGGVRRVLRRYRRPGSLP